MQIDYKYDIGQTVFFKINEYKIENIECTDCGGIGLLTRKDGKEITCPTCKGKKCCTKRKMIESISSAIVDRIEIFIEQSNNVSIMYHLDNGDEYEECEIFENELNLKENFMPLDEILDSINVVPSYNGDYRELFTNIPKEDWIVHEHHCCKIHGCKYDDHQNCPVCLGLIKQHHLCEECKNEEFNNLPF